MVADAVRRFLFRHVAGRVLYEIVYNLDKHYGVLAASAIAFDAFLSLIPLAAFGGYILQRLHQKGEVVLAPLLRGAPPPVAELVIDSVSRLSATSAAVVAPVSIAAFLWTSSAGISTAMGVFENTFASPPRPWWWRRLIAMASVIAAVAMMGVLAGAQYALTQISTVLAGVYALVVPLATMVVMLAGFFRVAVRAGGPHPKRRVLPGVGATLILWTLVSVLFSLYVAKIARYATLYGGLAAVAIFLFWLWLLALALLVGGEVNAQLDGIREASPDR